MFGNIGTMISIALRAITHREDIEKLMPRIAEAEQAGRKLMDTVTEARALATKIAPELFATTAAPEKTLDVKWLQQSLNQLIDAKLVVDGQYGPLTKAAVEEFQRRNGLTVDGWAGVLTEAKILELLGG
jgi:peptidoglycan hydrolase-like protein with peptidoglycan-binding domain